MKRAYIVIKNIFSNFSAQALLFIISFFTTPIIFNNFGATKYGLLTILNTIPHYFSVLDFGLIPTLIKYLSENKNKQSTSNSRIILSTNFTLFLIISIFWSFIIFTSSSLLVNNVLNIPDNLKILSLSAIKLVGINFIFLSLANFFSSIPQALQRFEIFNLKNIFIGITIPLGTIILLLNNKGIIEILYLQIIVNLIVSLFFYLISLKLLKVNFIKLKISLKAIKKNLSFGGFKLISGINARVVFQLNQFLIATFLPIEQVSYYTIPVSLTQKITSLIPNITTPIFPLASELSSLSLTKKLRSLYKKSTRLSTFFITPFLVFIFFFSHSILSTWISPDFANKSSTILKLLCIAYLIASFPAVLVSIVEGIGKPKIPAFFSTLTTLIYLLMAVYFIPKYSLIGAVLSILLNRVFITPIFIYFVTKKIMKINNGRHYFNNYLKPLMIGVLGIIPILYFLPYLNQLWKILFMFSIYLIIYFLLAYLVNIINKNDFRIVRKLLKISVLDKIFLNR